MEEAFKDEVSPNRWLWCLINNLSKFDEKPEYIVEFFKKFHKVKDHPVLSSFENVVNTIENYYKENNRFPDMDWLQLNYRNIRTITVMDDPFSMQIYDSIIKYIDREVLRRKINNLLIESEDPRIDDFRYMAEEIAKFATNNVEEEEMTSDSLRNLYKDHKQNYDGIPTYIKPIDDVIGVLGHRSLSAFAAPSGHGKSTFAFSVAYYAALSGKVIEYLSFEVPAKDVWFNFVSMESYGTEHPIPASRLKQAKLSEDEEKYFSEHMERLMKKIDDSHGYLHIVDQTRMSGVSTYTDLCAKLESYAEKRGRKADLIIVDNVDNFQTLKSDERDEVSRINNYIIKLDSFTKTYYNNKGVAILLLSQVNRPAMAKLYKAANEAGKGSTHIDVTCVQKYNALYEKPTCVLLGFADEAARSSGIMRIHPVKLRNSGVPIKPIQVKVDYAFSRVMGDFASKKMNVSQEEYNKTMNELISSEDAAEIDSILAEG